ncbi:MAG: amidohydrolase [Pyrinomonadaceae bacterium MAG19_C2-C3]|nr:amidohydrolase [Pyrinomonadaceae bacterium MAG19_C2-C3]
MHIQNHLQNHLTRLAAVLIFALTLAPLTNSAQRNQIEQADLILTNGVIFTADDADTIAEAVAIKGNRIVAVGTTKDITSRFRSTPNGKTIDLRGRLVTPGFNDAHIHFLNGGISLLNVDLNGAKSLDEALRRIAEKVKNTPEGVWITGRGWDHTLWGNRFPTGGDLDKITTKHPVFLTRVDGHVSWANSLALQKANVTKATNAPEGGEIERDANGEATGILKETAAGLVGRVIPPTTNADRARGLEIALKQAREYGITSINDNSGYEATKIYRDFIRQNKLTVRVAEWQDFEDSIEELKAQRAEFQTFKDNPFRLRLTALKGYVDGTLGSRTAAMLAPFSDDHDNAGIPRRPQEELTKMIVERATAGFQIALHAIGDKANRMAIEGFDKALSRNVVVDGHQRPFEEGNRFLGVQGKTAAELHRHRIEHAQVIAPSDFKRFDELGIIASMQPSHAISDKRWAGERLGEYRTLGAYAWHLMRSHNVHTPFGTDFPVEGMSPYVGLFAAVTRQSTDLEPQGGWQPQERLSIRDALRCYTRESAYASFEENDKGQIKAGMLADLVVHTKNLLTIEPREILTTEAAMTIFDGKVIYERR